MTQTEGETNDGLQPLYKDLEKYNPFAIVDEVHADSPAEKGGLKNGDFILQFGETRTMHEIPKQIHENMPLVLKIFRVSKNEGRELLDIKIVPAKWSGQGLVGSHILPISL